MSPEAMLARLRQALDLVVDPCSIATGVPITLQDMGLVQSVTCRDGHAQVVLRLTSPLCWQQTNIIEAVENALGQVADITSVACAIDHSAQWLPNMMAGDAQARLRRIRPLDGAASE